MSLTYWLQYAIVGLLIALSPHAYAWAQMGFKRTGELHGEQLRIFFILALLAPLGTVVLFSALIGALVRIFF
jgi:hypothetical protein